MGASRQLRAVFFGTVLVVAAFSTGINFLFFLVYLLAILLVAAVLVESKPPPRPASVPPVALHAPAP